MLPRRVNLGAHASDDPTIRRSMHVAKQSPSMATWMLLACHLGEPSRVAGRLGEREEQPSCMCEHVFVVLLCWSSAILLLFVVQHDGTGERPTQGASGNRRRSNRSASVGGHVPTCGGTLSKSSYKHPNPAELFPQRQPAGIIRSAGEHIAAVRSDRDEAGSSGRQIQLLPGVRVCLVVADRFV